MRLVAPSLTAQLTWAIKRRQDGHALAALDALVRRGDAVVDAGANWGLYAARLAHLAGRTGQVDAFEPHPAHARTLRALARRHPQLSVHAAALSSAAGSAQLHVPIINGRAVTALSSLSAPTGVPHDVVSVPVVTLDAALAGRRSPSLIKCDVEGLELEVLRGAERTLCATLPTLLVEVEQRHQAAPIDATFSYLRGLGYVGWFFGPRGLAPLDEFDVERDQLAHLRPGAAEYGMPQGYVADFLFTRPEVDVSRLSARTVS